MKLFFFSPYDILRSRTNQISDIRMCEGLATQVKTITYYCQNIIRKDNIAKNSIHKYYGLEKKINIRISKIPLTDNTPSFLRVLVHIFLNIFQTALIALKNITFNGRLIFFSRSVDLLLPAVLLNSILPRRRKIFIVIWLHEVILKKRYLTIYKNVDLVVATNSKIIEDLNISLNKPDFPFVISLNPITSSQLSQNFDKVRLREELNLPIDKVIVGYTGKLYINQSEINYILDAAAALTDYVFLFTGGKPGVIEYYHSVCKKKQITNIIFTGFLMDYSKIIKYQYLSDVLVSYYTKQDHLTEYNLPQKIPEYMLTGNPIVTPDYPATKDILNEKNTIFVKPENADSLIEGIRNAVERKEYSKLLAQQARKDVEEISFEKKAKLIIDKLQSVLYA